MEDKTLFQWFNEKYQKHLFTGISCTEAFHLAIEEAGFQAYASFASFSSRRAARMRSVNSRRRVN